VAWGNRAPVATFTVLKGAATGRKRGGGVRLGGKGATPGSGWRGRVAWQHHAAGANRGVGVADWWALLQYGAARFKWF
jgi:hypothetical protein